MSDVAFIVTFAAVLYLIGISLFIAGGVFVITGRNLPGWLGKGFTRSDDLRLARAPAIYFRALGTLVAVIGVLVLWAGAAMGLTRTSAVYEFQIWIAGFIFLLLGLLATFAWLFVLARRYKLFRWNKP